MKRHILFKYIFKELILYFAVSFLFFFLIFFINQILLMAEDILKKRVPIADVALLILYSLPFIIAQSAPFATLVGFLMCIGKMVSDNEILVLRALGNSFSILLVPVLICGMVISFFSFYVNDYLLPAGTIGYNNLYRKVLLSNPGVEFESYAVKRMDSSTLVMGEVTDKNVSSLLIFDFDEKNNRRIIIAGPTEVVSAPDPSVVMQLQMNDATIIAIDRDNPRTCDMTKTGRTDLSIFSADIPSISSGNNPREMTSLDLTKQLRKMKADGESTPYEINLWELELNKKISMPFGSFFFALLALPLAVVFGKHNGQTIGLIIGIFISVIYWALLIMGQIFGMQNGFSGFWSMWLPNLLVLLAGLLLLARLVRK